MPNPEKYCPLHLSKGCGVRCGYMLDGWLYNTSAFYDSMIAKRLFEGDQRQEAITRMKRALDEFKIEEESKLQYLFTKH